MDVVKSNGKTEEFKEEKIKKSIEKAAKQAGYNSEEKMNLVNKTVQDVKQRIGNKKQVRAEDIRNLILNDLDEEEQKPGETEIGMAWREWEEKHGITYQSDPKTDPHVLDEFKRQ